MTSPDDEAEAIADRLTALAERVEALMGPSRRADADISLMVGLTAREQAGFNRWNGCRARDAEPRQERDWLIVHGRKFTASLDAAMTLIPNEYLWGIEREDGAGPVSAYVGWTNETWSTSATAALALTAAALRARAAQSRTRSNGEQ